MSDIPTWLPGVFIAVAGAVVSVVVAVWRAGAKTERVLALVDSLKASMGSKADDTETALRLAGLSERTSHMATADRVAALEHRIDRIERQMDDRAHPGAKR